MAAGHLLHPGRDCAFLAEVLTKEHAATTRALIRTAIQWQRPPSAWVGGDGSWTPQDHLLTHAWTIYQDMLCPDCGQPKDVCSSTSYSVETRVCGVAAAIGQWREQNKDIPHGTQALPVPAIATQGSATVASAPDWWLEKQGLKETE